MASTIKIDAQGNRWTTAEDGSVIPYGTTGTEQSQLKDKIDSGIKRIGENTYIKWNPVKRQTEYVDAPPPELTAGEKLARDKTFGESTLIASGRELSKLGRGVGKWFGGDEFDQRMDQMNVEEDLLYKPMQKFHGGADLAGQMLTYAGPQAGAGVGRTAANIASKLPGVGGAFSKSFPKVNAALTADIAAPIMPAAVAPIGKGARRLHGLQKAATGPTARAAGEGALFGAAHQDSDAISGAAFGMAGQKLGQSLLNPLSKTPNELTRRQANTVDWADAKGFKLWPGVRSGNRSVQEVDQALQKNFQTSDILARDEMANRKLATTVVAEKLGLKDVDELDDVAINRAESQISNEITALKNDISSRINVDDQVAFHNHIRQLRNSGIPEKIKAAKDLKKQWNRIWGKMAQDTPDRQGGRVLSGQQYQDISRDWRKSISKGYEPNSSVYDDAYGKGLNEFKKLIDNGVDRQMMMTTGKGDALKKWKAANQKWNVLMDARTALSGNNKYSGLIDPQRLYHTYMQKYPDMMIRGKFFDEDLMKLAELGNLQKTQSGASLGASQMLGRVLNSGKGDPKAGATGLLTMGLGKLPFGENAALSLYKSGYPVNTGLLGLPSSTPGVGGLAGKGAALSAMGEASPGEVVKDEYKAMAEGLENWWDTSEWFK